MAQLPDTPHAPLPAHTRTWTDTRSCISRNPIYHQVVFATLMLSTAVRTVHLLRKPELRARLPEQMRTVVGRTFTAGASIFAFGFFVWNLDNVFCGTVTGWKKNIGWPGAFLLEGHSWWHVFTVSYCPQFKKKLYSISAHAQCADVLGFVLTLLYDWAGYWNVSHAGRQHM